MNDIVIDSQTALQTALGTLRSEWEQHKYLRLKLRRGRDRSPEQNSHSHAWYGQLERELPEDDAAGWKRLCKLRFGVPIMRADDSDFREMYDAKLRHLPYETKLTLMEWVPITSLMTKAQLKKYEVAMQEYFRDNYNVKLEYIEKRKAA